MLTDQSVSIFLMLLMSLIWCIVYTGFGMKATGSF